jgi:hypothetical protein
LSFLEQLDKETPVDINIEYGGISGSFIRQENPYRGDDDNSDP